MDADKVFDVTNLSCIRQDKTLFLNINFTLHAGDILLIEGANGAGKSTLLRLLAGLTTPQSGSISWHHQSIQQLRNRYWQDVHYLSHQNGIKSGLTINENLTLAAQLLMQPLKHLEQTLVLLQLNDNQHTLAHHLSAGQQRRLALAKLILFPKPLWLLDEPLTSLDVATQQLFLSQLDLHKQNGGIAIISSHHAISLNGTEINTLRLGKC